VKRSGEKSWEEDVKDRLDQVLDQREADERARVAKVRRLLARLTFPRRFLSAP